MVIPLVPVALSEDGMTSAWLWKGVHRSKTKKFIITEVNIPDRNQSVGQQSRESLDSDSFYRELLWHLGGRLSAYSERKEEKS